MMKRVLAIDYGRRRIGVAVTDPEGIIAVPLLTLHRERKISDRLRRLARLAEQHEVDGFVLGLPLEMSGDEGEMARTVRDFGARLSERTSLPVVFIDERLTSVEAAEVLEAAGVRGARRKEVIDQVAAVVILQNWMAARDRKEAQ